MIVSPSSSCVGNVREVVSAAGPRGGRHRARAGVRELAPRVFELSELLVKQLGVEDVGAAFPHRVAYHPTCHSLRVTHVGEAPLDAAPARARARARAVRAADGVLRLRRHVRAQERRHLDGDAVATSATSSWPAAPRYAPRSTVVPAADRRRPRPARPPLRACTSPRSSRDGPLEHRELPQGGASASSRTCSSARTCAARPTRSRPSAPGVVGELPDWEELREAGRAIKADVLARLDEYLVAVRGGGDGSRRAGPLGLRRGRGERRRRSSRAGARRRPRC